jgi:uroporphyrinogen decarboxylase
MDKLTRVKNAVAGKPVDRPPVCFWHHFGDIGPEATVRGHLNFFRESGIDMLKMMSDEFFVYPLEGVKTPEDFLKLRPLGPGSRYVTGQTERASQINDGLKGETWSFYNAFSPYATLKHTIGDEASMALIRTSPEAARHVLNVIAEDTCHVIEGILTQSGTRGMMLALQGAEQGRFTPEEYHLLLTPSDLRVVECANRLSDVNILHMCGWDGIPNQLALWADYPARIINWAAYVEGIDLKEGKKRFPGRVVMGGFDNRANTLLPSGSKEAIQAEARRIVREAGMDGIIVGADCSLPNDIRSERIRWVVEALEEGA